MCCSCSAGALLCDVPRHADWFCKGMEAKEGTNSMHAIKYNSTVTGYSSTVAELPACLHKAVWL